MDGEFEKFEMLRQRRRDDDEDVGIIDHGWRIDTGDPGYPHDPVPDNTCLSGSGIHKLSMLFTVAVILCSWSFLYGAAFYLNYRLPSLQGIAPNCKERFIGVRAKALLKNLTECGIKVPGSYALEAEAYQLIEREIIDVMRKLNSFSKMTFERQDVNGSYYLAQKVGFLSVYRNVRNLVVRIGPHSDHQGEDLPSLLVNCHYDSAPSSPGSSDDGLNCAVMLEVLRKLARQSYPLQSNVVFLFNGAEETPLQGSHGFITQYRLEHKIKAFINLESCGAGGKEVLFQTGPENPWLVQLYGEGAEHPSGLVLAEELFQAGLVPSDTDFRIFRDFGHKPGLDFAHCDNGFVYHTKLDNMDAIRDGVYQHTGDNLLALIRHITSSKVFHNSHLFKKGRMVYFDVAGLFFIRYSESFAYILNLATVLLSISTVAHNILTNTSGMPIKDKVKQLVMCLLVPGLGFVLAIAFVIIIAVALDIVSSVLSWYSKPYLILLLYFVPTLIAYFLPPLVLNKFKLSKLCDRVRAQLYCNGFQLFWTLALLISTLAGVRSAYVLLIAVIFPAVTNLILILFRLQHDVSKWLTIYCCSTIIPALYFVNLFILSTRLFIPIAGRSGPNVNPELVIGVIAALLCSIIYGYITPLIILAWKPWRLVYGFIAVHLITLFLVVCTPVGFPFSQHSPQRLIVLHTIRSFHNEAGDLIKSDTGRWIMHLDRLAPKTYRHIPWFENVTNVDSDCKDYLYCGLPLYYTRIASLERNPGSWVPSPEKKPLRDVKVSLDGVDTFGTNMMKFNFTIIGPYQMLIFLSPKEGVTITHWDLDEKKPMEGLKWGTRPTYIIRFTSGGYPAFPQLSFCVDVEIQRGFENLTSHLDLAVSAHYIDIMQNQEVRLKKIYPKSFLSWTQVTPWSAVYKSYVF